MGSISRKFPLHFTNNKVNQLIKQKNIKIKGIDVDIGSIKVCQKRIIKYGLQNHVEAECISLFDIKKKYDYILFMESFPVISNELFIDFILHAKTLVKDGCQDRIKLYHNLIEKHEYTKGREFFKKTILHIITLNDFGKLTTRDKMEEILVEHCQVDRSKINMQVLLECTYKEMSGVFFCIPVLRNKVIRQYLISL